MIALKTENKRCRTCGEHFPATLEYFHADPKGSDGLNRKCKACTRQSYKKRQLRYYPQPIAAIDQRPGGLCGVSDCHRRANSKGYCKACYMRTWRHARERIGTKEGPNESSANPLPTLDQARENYENACTVAARLQWRAMIRELETLSGKGG